MNNASKGVGKVNHIQAPVATEIEIPEELGQSKCKRIPRKLGDALNGCLWGLVLDSLLQEVVLKCKQAGCETQWVSTLYYEHRFIS